MSPTLSFLVGLTALIPQVFSLVILADPTVGLINSNSSNTPENPLPPAPPGWYKIPGTTLSIFPTPPYGPPIPFPPAALSCLTAAQSAISTHIATHGDSPIAAPTWTFAAYGVRLAASAPFRRLGTYSQLSSALTGVLHFVTAEGGPGAREFRWVLADDVEGIVIRGEIGAGTVEGAVVRGSRTVATATATQSLSIVGVKELDSS